MSLLRTHLCVVVLLFAQTASAQTALPPAVAKPRAIQAYEEAWRETNSAARLKAIRTFWLESSTYVDPAASVKGPVALNTMIDGFIKQFPGAILEGDPLLAKDNAYTWNWRIFDANRKLLIAGRDYAELDGAGHITKLVGFWETQSPESRNAKVVATYFESLFKTRDFKTLATVLHADAVYYQAEGLPYGGTFTGFAQWTKMFLHAGSLFDMEIAEEPTYMFNAAKDRIVLSFVIRCTAKTSGKTITMPISEHFDVKDGKIASIRPFYFDTKAFAEFLK